MNYPLRLLTVRKGVIRLIGNKSDNIFSYLSVPITYEEARKFKELSGGLTSVSKDFFYYGAVKEYYNSLFDKRKVELLEREKDREVQKLNTSNNYEDAFTRMMELINKNRID